MGDGGDSGAPRLARMAVIPAVLVALAGVAVAGCGSDTETVTSTVTERTVTVQPTTETTTETSTSASTGTTGGSVTPGPSLSSFKSPSGNIGCYLIGGTARCDIRERSWSPPPRPANCPLDWGQGLEVGSSGSRVVCAGDTALDPSAPVLAYGRSTAKGSIECVSATEGVTCTDNANWHGFFISRQSYRLF
ncbi:MAG: DUF6636 domain-containing protein [Solirubrobacterales bacterium]